jgi:hypothetical protein
MASITVEIARPPDEVFAFVTDPAKLSAWQDAEEVQQLTEGPVRAGTRFREVHKAMGRRRVELKCVRPMLHSDAATAAHLARLPADRGIGDSGLGTRHRG